MAIKNYLYTGELTHWPNNLDFDPTYGLSVEEFIKIQPPQEPVDFRSFWEETFNKNRDIPLSYTIKEIYPGYDNDYRSFEVYFNSWDGFKTGALIRIPKNGNITRGLLEGHGYGGREHFHVNRAIENAAIIYPVHRGFHMSMHGQFPVNNGGQHVLHNIESRDNYIIRGCVAEMWTAISVLQDFAPEVGDNILYRGCSFGGGIGALTIPWDKRIKKAQLIVPTFGLQSHRLRCKCKGSGQPVADLFKHKPEIEEVLKYYDAAVAAKYIEIPVLAMPAFYDPVVPPPGQFAICNALKGDTTYYITSSGHGVFAQNQHENDKMFEVEQDFFN